MYVCALVVSSCLPRARNHPNKTAPGSREDSGPWRISCCRTWEQQYIDIDPECDSWLSRCNRFSVRREKPYRGINRSFFLGGGLQIKCRKKVTIILQHQPREAVLAGVRWRWYSWYMTPGSVFSTREKKERWERTTRERSDCFSFGGTTQLVACHRVVPRTKGVANLGQNVSDSPSDWGAKSPTNYNYRLLLLLECNHFFLHYSEATGYVYVCRF